MNSTLSGPPSRFGSKWTAALLLVAVATMLAMFIYVGWDRLLLPIAGADAVPFAALLTLTALLLARLIGVSWFKEARDAEETGRRARFQWLVLYPFFFLISALGVINLAFYGFEGPSVLEENIDSASSALTELLATAQSVLRDENRDERVSRIRANLVALEKEINNPNGSGHCGVGPVAQGIIDKITQDLPGFHEPSGSKDSRVCGPAAEKLYHDYEDQANRILANDPDAGFNAANGPVKQSYLKDLIADVTKTTSNLQQARQGLANSDIGSRGDSYSAARISLEQAATTYNSDRQRLEKLAPSGVSLSMTLDIGPSEDLGAINTIISTVFKGGHHTYLYVAIAVALDFLVIYLFKLVRAEFEVGPIPQGPLPKGPRFLWANPR